MGVSNWKCICLPVEMSNRYGGKCEGDQESDVFMTSTRNLVGNVEGADGYSYLKFGNKIWVLPAYHKYLVRLLENHNQLSTLARELPHSNNSCWV